MAALLGLLRIELLYLVAFLTGILGVFFGAAYGAYVGGLVSRERLREANSKLATTSSIAYILGPGLAGILIQAQTAPIANIGEGLSFIVSALCLSFSPASDLPAARMTPERNLWAEMLEGVQALLGNSVLRAFLLSSVTFDVFWNTLMVVYFLYVSRELGLPPSVHGLIFGVGSVGALLGSIVNG
jgi:MFS family permease